MKRIITLLCRIVEGSIVLASMLVCTGYLLSPQDDLEFGMERITGITGYVLDGENTDLILHQTNTSDSIVIVSDNRSIDTVRAQLNRLVTTDARWKCVQIAESDVYKVVSSSFSDSYQTDQHFRPVCEISGGCYDYMFYETKDGDIKGCLIDIDTGTIALYIFNTN